MEVMPIPCPHFKITIVKRSQGQSAVAGAAYQSGERLFSEYDQKTKFYNKKKELVHAEIMLPSHAPPGYADRATLWNAVEAVENQWNSQLARRIVLAFPVEVPKEQYLKMIREFCQEQFVSKGMIADFAIHDKGDGNPHAHILLTLRAMDEYGKWLPKARKVYDLDENGERIRLPSGNWKCHKENTVDWNDQKYAEVWRHGWETITNRYLEAAGRPERVDLRSFERQGMMRSLESNFWMNKADSCCGIRTCSTPLSAAIFPLQRPVCWQTASMVRIPSMVIYYAHGVDVADELSPGFRDRFFREELHIPDYLLENLGKAKPEEQAEIFEEIKNYVPKPKKVKPNKVTVKQAEKAASNTIDENYDVPQKFLELYYRLHNAESLMRKSWEVTFDLNPKLLTHPEQVKVLRFALKPHLEFLKTLDEVLAESSGESSKTA